MRQRITAALLVISLGIFAAAQAKKAAGGEDEAIIHNYILTMPDVQKYAGVMQAGQQAAQNDPALAAEFQKIQNTDVDNVGKQKMVENSPHVIAFLKQHGMTAKQFVFIPQVLMTAAIAAEAQQQGGKSVGFVNPANIDFVKQHKQELDKLQLMGGGAEEQQQQ